MKEEVSLADTGIIPETIYVFNRIKEIAKQGYAFGRQDATLCGLEWKNTGNEYRSYINDIVGDRLGVSGFDIGHIEISAVQNLNLVFFQKMKQLIIKIQDIGGVITLSWHANNVISRSITLDSISTLKHIRKSGAFLWKYSAWLLQLTDFMNDLADKKGKVIPIVHRPYQEMNGAWFWLGKDSCTPDEYKTLWRKTIQIHSEEYHLQNLVYAYSPNSLKDSEEYSRFYPRGTYVDTLGTDINQHANTEDYIKQLQVDIGLSKKIGLKKNKPYALTEGGLDQIPVTDWWTQTLDKELANSAKRGPWYGETLCQTIVSPHSCDNNIAVI